MLTLPAISTIELRDWSGIKGYYFDDLCGGDQKGTDGFTWTGNIPQNSCFNVSPDIYSIQGGTTFQGACPSGCNKIVMNHLKDCPGGDSAVQRNLGPNRCGTYPFGSIKSWKFTGCC